MTTDWLAIAALAISALTALGGFLGYVQAKRSQDRKRADVKEGQVLLLVDHVIALQHQIAELGGVPKPIPDGIFPKE